MKKKKWDGHMTIGNGEMENITVRKGVGAGGEGRRGGGGGGEMGLANLSCLGL